MTREDLYIEYKHLRKGEIAMSLGMGIVGIIRSIFSERPKQFTITRGIGPRSVNDLRYVLEGIDVECGPWAFNLFCSSHFHLGDTVTPCELISVTAEDLGVKENEMVTREEIYTRARHEGLVECPPDIGALFWLQFPDIIESGKRFAIGMKPIPDPHGEPSIFCVQYDGKVRGIYGAHGEPDHLWHSNHRWVFAHVAKVH